MRDLNINLDFIQDINSKLKMKKLLDKIEIVLKNHSTESTDFLDPYEIKLSKSILNQISEIGYLEYGGIDEAERKIIYLFPEYLKFSELDDKIGYLQVELLKDLSHRDYLGSILALGIVREKIGDILIYKDKTIFIVKKEIKDYILMNLSQIGNTPVNIYESGTKPIGDLLENFDEFQIHASSLRLDIVLSSIYNISRSESLKKIKSNHVKINWEQVDKPTKLICEGDTLSLKGFGRSKIFSFKGPSRKGKHIIIVRKLKWWSDAMITPLDIQNKNFKKSIMGFNQNQVNSFLQEMIEDYEAMYKENISYKERINLISDQLNQFKTLEETLKTTLLVAQKSADELTLNARNKAEMILENAEDKGQKIIDKKQEDVKHIQEEYEFLKKELFIFKTRFSSFLQSQLTSLDEFYLEVEKKQVIQDLVVSEE